MSSFRGMDVKIHVSGTGWFLDLRRSFRETISFLVGFFVLC